MPIISTLFLFLLALFVVQAFWGYKLRHFFRLFPGFLAGLLISFTTGYLMFMDGTRGDLTRLLMNLGGGDLLSKAISDGDILGLLKLLATDETARDILMKILPDSAKAFMAFGVLVCIACTIACAALEKPGVFLELFSYGYTVTASICTAKESTLLGAILGIAVGALLGMLGYKISRGWIIVVPNLFDFWVTLFLSTLILDGAADSGNILAGFLFSAISIASLALLAAIPIGVRRQFKATAVPKDGAAQSAAAASGPKGKWVEKFKIDFWDVITIAFFAIVFGHWLGVLISLASLALFVAIRIGQSKATAVPKDGTVQSTTAASGLRGKWAEKFKAVTNFVPAMPSAQSKANPTLRNTPPGGQKFCSKCGNSLAPGAKFCAKCGAPTQSGEDAAKPM